jgi:hypothetical protein
VASESYAIPIKPRPDQKLETLRAAFLRVIKATNTPVKIGVRGRPMAVLSDRIERPERARTSRMRSRKTSSASIGRSFPLIHCRCWERRREVV